LLVLLQTKTKEEFLDWVIHQCADMLTDGSFIASGLEKDGHGTDDFKFISQFESLMEGDRACHSVVNADSLYHIAMMSATSKKKAGQSQHLNSFVQGNAHSTPVVSYLYS
jgi:hypothetical protein